MRLIGELKDPQQAEKFSAFLTTQGIAIKSEESQDGKQEIWVKDEDQFSTALRELEEFKVDPANAKYANAVNQANLIAREKEKKRKEIQKRIVNVSADGISKRPTVTIVLIGICVIVALLTDFGNQEGAIFRALEFVSIGPPQSIALLNENNGNRDSLNIRLANIKRGEIWRLVTPILIHLDTFHLLFNMVWLFQLGRMIENRYGPYRLAMLVLLTAVISNLFQCTVPVGLGGSAPGLADGYLLTRLGGMSGVVYGLLGYVWMKAIYDRTSGFFLSQTTLVIMLGWLVFCMIPGATQNLFGTNVANWAHAVGLIVGLLVGYSPMVFRGGTR